MLTGGFPKPRASSAFAKLALDPVKVLDLTKEPRAADGMISAFKGFVDLTSGVGPAGGAFELRGVLVEEGLVGAVAVALKGALVVPGNDIFETVVATSGVPVVADAALRSGDFDEPEVALFGLAVAGGEVFERRFVNLEVRTFEEFWVDGLSDGLKMKGALFGPTGKGLARDLNAVALSVNLLLAVKWKVIAVFRGDDLGEQSGGRQTTFDQAFGEVRNDGRLVLITPTVFDVFGTDEAFFKEASGLVVELFADFFADFAPCFGTSFDGLRKEDFFFDGKVLGETWLSFGAFLLLSGPGVLIHQCGRVAGGFFELSRQALPAQAFQE